MVVEVREMATHRSPNYPAHGLREAIEMVRQVYAKEKRSPSPPEIVAKALGYSSLSGVARVKIASLKQYGLLEGHEQKGLRVSDTAMRLLYPENSLQESDALKTAALSPSLFNTLLKEKGDASDEAMINFLVSRLSFTEGGAKQAIAAFRDTMKVSGLDTFGYNEGDTPSQPEAQNMQTETRTTSAMPQSTVSSTSGEVNAWTWTLSMPRSVRAALNITGPVEKRDIARLIKQLNALKDAFDDDETESSEDEGSGR
jgi:hypothetical protein